LLTLFATMMGCTSMIVTGGGRSLVRSLGREPESERFHFDGTTGKCSEGRFLLRKSFDQIGYSYNQK
jgi:hypothetical protein